MHLAKPGAPQINRWYLIVAMFLCLSFPLSVSTAQAQESQFVEAEMMQNEASSKLINATGVHSEFRSSFAHVRHGKDSTTIVLPSAASNKKPKQEQASKPVEKQTAPREEEEESILSFNFLYYIIQKYKLQDIVD